jgi:hypothetical protein
MAGMAIGKFSMHIYTMRLAVTYCTSGYHLVLGLVTIDA